MKSKIFKPSPSFLTKIRVVVSLIIVVIYLGMALIAWPIGSDKGTGAAIIFLMVISIISGLALVIGLLLTGPYYRSLSYEIQDDEVIMRVGIVTKSVKHVPYRTVTNITVKRGILDRWFFGLGTLNIQTAGMSGTTGAEESLEGLPNVDEVYDLVVTELRRFRSGMAPTAADSDVELSSQKENAFTQTDIFKSILTELQAIREVLATSS